MVGWWGLLALHFLSSGYQHSDAALQEPPLSAEHRSLDCEIIPATPQPLARDRRGTPAGSYRCFLWHLSLEQRGEAAKILKIIHSKENVNQPVTDISRESLTPALPFVTSALSYHSCAFRSQFGQNCFLWFATKD